MAKIINIDIVETRIKELHGDEVQIVRSTYCGTSKQATFIDVDHGEWTAWVSNVLTGHSHPKRGRTKSNTTCSERYDATTPLGSASVRKKIEKTNLLRHGNKNVWSEGSDVRTQCVETLKVKYNVDNPQKSEEIREKTHNTNLQRYGVKHPLQSKEILDRAVATHTLRYGVSNPLQLQETKDKVVRTCLERYGVENPMQHPMFFKSSQRNNRRVNVEQHWKSGEELVCCGSYELAVVNWLNLNKIDFQWQVPFKIPNTLDVDEQIRGRTYIVDALLIDYPIVGANTYIEIKGHWRQEVSKKKWIWFSSVYNSSELWTYDVLKRMNIISRRGK